MLEDVGGLGAGFLGCWGLGDGGATCADGLVNEAHDDLPFLISDGEMNVDLIETDFCGMDFCC